MLLTIFIIAVIAIIIAMTFSEGLWSNTLAAINTVLAAVVATNYWEPAANFLEGQFPSFTYFWDFLAMWLVFSLVYLILRKVTDQISPTKIRFRLPVEQVGRFVAAGLTAWVFVCFLVFSLHAAPLARKSFRGAFQPTPEATNFFLSPDRLWLGFMQSRSEGAFKTASENVFDPKSEYILKYGERRERFSQMPTHRVRVGRGGRR